jgi:hypothetical protein
LVLVGASAWAAGPGAVRKQVEASMLVTGTIDIDPEGHVVGYSLDQEDRLPEAAVSILGTHIPDWKFEPVLVAGKPSHVSVKTSIRLIAKKVDEDEYLVRVSGAHFGSHTDVDAPRSSGLMTPPRYPRELARAGVGGTAYLIVKVGADGEVEDVIAEQVNLRAVASDGQMSRMREQLARTSIATARKWRFTPPVEPASTDPAPWLLRVPVDFLAPGQTSPKYGAWRAYVPGPRQANPWSKDNEDVSPDTLVAGGVYPVGQSGPKLLSSLDPAG